MSRNTGVIYRGSLNGTHFGGIKLSNNANIYIYMVVSRDFPYNGALFGLVI